MSAKKYAFTFKASKDKDLPIEVTCKAAGYHKLFANAQSAIDDVRSNYGDNVKYVDKLTKTIYLRGM